MSDNSEADPAAPAAAAPAAESGAGTPYRVLARKYRPASFEDLIGQDALVRTLTNAIRAGRVPQAFVLTGVRGVGKTTTARIIARALNCVGADGQGGATVQPCGVCEHCTAIAQDRHVDVIEMDAASRTGVDDIRDLIDGVRYRPVTARRKVYVVDEVHMLSRNAFNALLKTLEEPPEHVTFVFATTEIRKVPVTVLSRCMRFDLRRVEQQTLAEHFAGILQKEDVAAEDAALQMVARAADGSVRDGLSLLDQAIALSGGSVTEALVKDMLGLADRGRIYDLYDAVLGGRAAEALDLLGELYAAGADPAVVLQDLLEVTHTLTRLQVVGAEAATAGLPEVERTRGKEMAEALGRGTLARNWQMLLKGLQETQSAPQPRQAAEMVLLRLIHAAELPSPADLVKQIKDGGGAPPAGGSGGSGGGSRSAGAGAGGSVQARAGAQAAGGSAAPRAAPRAQADPQADPEVTAAPTPQDRAAPQPQSLQDVIALAQRHREFKLAAELRSTVHLVRFEPGHIELRPNANAPKDLAGNLGRLLGDWTGRRWVVSLSQEAGQETVKEAETRRKQEAEARLMEHPHVKAVLEHFPGARLVGHSGAAGAPPARDQPGDEDASPPADDDGLAQFDPDAGDADPGAPDPDDPRFH